MATKWKAGTLMASLSLFELCNGFPIDMDKSFGDSYTRFITTLIAVLLTICTVVFLVGCLCCQRRNGFKDDVKVFKNSPMTVVNRTGGGEVDPGHVNPIANGEFTIFTPLGSTNSNAHVFLEDLQQSASKNDDEFYHDVSVCSWFDRSENEFPRSRLKYIRELGKGWFGTVVEGATLGEASWTPVVVRILDTTANTKEKLRFLRDVEVFRVSSHENILPLVGRCLESVPFLLLQKFCPTGDLKKYLRERSCYDKLLSSHYPLLWCSQLTSAVRHIHERKIVHPDLAARNCLLTQDLQLVVGDYGLSALNYPEDYYQCSPAIPVRWCAPESLIYTMTTLQCNQVNFEANIWSLGVTFWEIWERGQLPYQNLTDDEVIVQVLGPSKFRLPRPTCSSPCTDYIFVRIFRYRIMHLCWSSLESRPDIYQLDRMVTDLRRKTTEESRLNANIFLDDFERRWETLKRNDLLKTEQEIETEENEALGTKVISPSLNNLLDDSVESCNESQTDLWLKEVVEKKDSGNIQSGEKEDSKDVSFQNNIMNKKIQFEPTQVDSLTYKSSESEAEDENWRRKVETGAYTEKVRQKSRSVADLMILTHIDYSESDSETPLPSLEYSRANYRNVRCTTRQSNLESASLVFGSEGNLLNVKETFQEELRRLQEERRDSLLFVPDKDSSRNHNENNEQHVYSPTEDDTSGSPSKKLIQEFTSSSEMKPPTQVFNVYNVMVESRFSPIYPHHPRKEITSSGYQVPKLVDIIQSNIQLLDYIIQNYDEKSEEEVELKPSVFESSPDQTDNIEDENGEMVKRANLFVNQIVEDAIQKVTGSHNINRHFDLKAPRSTLILHMPNESMNFPQYFDQENEEEILQFSSHFTGQDESCNLENWNTFLDKTLELPPDDCFSSFNSEFDDKHGDSDSDSKKQVESKGNVNNTTSKGNWEDKEGWFLHPQSFEVSGELTQSLEQSGDTESYVGFGMDEEVMAAIRNELMEKLPRAQSASAVNMVEKCEEWETENRNEIFLRYNVYNPPLSPILEETLSEIDSKQSILGSPRESNTEEDYRNWSTPENMNDTFESPLPNEAIGSDLHLGHTTSQESCCSNDTLFNLEELICAVAEPEKKSNDENDEKKFNYTDKFLEYEKEQNTTVMEAAAAMAPLPSPENASWKQLPVTLLAYEKLISEEESDDVIQVDSVNTNNRREKSYQSAEISLHDPRAESDGMCILGDIRFTGPCDNQMMSTSFNEGNGFGEEQEWDSGSDTRSSSSGEFIWKEGDHEESVRALRAASNKFNNDKSIQPLEDVREEANENSTSSDEDCDSPEFVPSAWDKYAMPVKSALRSPEKTPERPEKEKKAKGVWFKKQKYHCIYEYPREPESPVLPSYELWKPTIEYNPLDWELHPAYEEHNIKKLDPFLTKDYSGSLINFLISSSTKSFNPMSSQFFPGKNYCAENVTPDSGVEDVTPDYNQKYHVQPLRILAANAARKSNVIKGNAGSDKLGGLRHTRDRLKLDLPPSPNAFSSAKAFIIEKTPEESPTFVTFGKGGRFTVQHVDTPECDDANEVSVKNVSFEALPYKPARKVCEWVEAVRGEASLLDSADEDSGIESSTLERKSEDV